MTRPRGRPAQGTGVGREEILSAALALLTESGKQGLTMRALASRLGVTAMSLYHHVDDRIGLLRAVSDRVYAGVLDREKGQIGPRAKLRAILVSYHDAVGSHPQLTLEIFASPEAFAGVTRQITDRVTALLAEMTDDPVSWRDILIDHAHGSGLSLCSAQGDQERANALKQQYELALTQLLDRLPP
ncbi:MAG TPA: TetR/AcrR family transcriptional regulator, partial [Roseateles sp.]|nr:TetR/AcrR family transcriptional regulator [Roseateles sp.]